MCPKIWCDGESEKTCNLSQAMHPITCLEICVTFPPTAIQIYKTWLQVVYVYTVGPHKTWGGSAIWPAGLPFAFFIISFLFPLPSVPNKAMDVPNMMLVLSFHPQGHYLGVLSVAMILFRHKQPWPCHQMKTPNPHTNVFLDLRTYRSSIDTACPV